LSQVAAAVVHTVVRVVLVAFCLDRLLSQLDRHCQYQWAQAVQVLLTVPSAHHLALTLCFRR